MLTRQKDTKLAQLFKDATKLRFDDQNRVFIDRDPDAF